MARPSYTEVFKGCVNIFYNYYRRQLEKSLDKLVVKEEDYIKIQLIFLGIPESLYLELNKYPNNRLIKTPHNLRILTSKEVAISLTSLNKDLNNYVSSSFFYPYETVKDILDPYCSFTLKRISEFEDACTSLKELNDKYTIQDLWKWSDIPRTVVNKVYGEIRKGEDNFSAWCNKTPAGTSNKFLELEPINEVLVWYNFYKAQQPK